jgi:hypothetical protein
MLTFEIIGFALLGLFFGALISGPQHGADH